MKVLMVITGLGMGGAEHVVVNLADKLILKDYIVKIVYLTGDALVLPSSDKIEIQPLGMKNKLDFLKAYNRLVEIIEDFSPDVVHSHMFHANILCRLVRMKGNIPRLICTAHSTNEGGFINMMAYRITDRLADVSTNVSQEAVDVFLKKKAVRPGRMIAIPNGIDVKKFSFSSDARKSVRKELGLRDSFVLLAVGRLDDAKDYPNLLHAFQIISKAANQSISLVIVGDGEIRGQLETLVSNLGLNGKVHFLGVRRDVPELMCAADIFVLSSKFEGFGLVVGEAMACERVVVSTDCGGVREVIGDAGYLVPPQEFSKLANKILELLRKYPCSFDELGKEARLRIKNEYSLDSNVSRYIKLYS